MIRQRLNQSDSTSQRRSSPSSKTSPSSPSSAKTTMKFKDKYGKKSSGPRRGVNCCCYLICSLLALFVFIAYIVVPVAFKYSPTVRRHLLFMNYVNFQRGMNLSNPESEYKLKCTRMFTVESSDDVTLGAWHVLPGSLVSKYCPTGFGADLKDEEASSFFNDDRPIVLYSHGNGGTRGGNHRLSLYKLLAYGPLDAHVIAFDYRGYGDSSPVDPSVPGLVDDAYHMYNWLASKVNQSRINVWGHSLGTAVSTALVKRIGVTPASPNTLTLEAPFNVMLEAIAEYPLAILYKFYPLFDYFFIEPFRQPEFKLFNSEANLKGVTIPVMILHAKDDAIVPFKLGYKLYETAVASSANHPGQPKPILIVYGDSNGFGHKNIYKHPSLSKVIDDFIFHRNIKQTTF